MNSHLAPTETLRSQRLEFGVFLFLLVAVSAILFWRFLPLPHQDLNYYSEPAYLLATSGRLAGPGSQAVDLTFNKGLYSYPPGYFLLLACWFRTFGLSPDSLLAYTHLAHIALLAMMWALIRYRYNCRRIVSILVILAVFPVFTHGRPDLTAAALGMAAWLAWPEAILWRRIILSGCLAAFTALVSPAFGIATASTLFVLQFCNTRKTILERTCVAAAWTVSLAVVFTTVVGTVLTLQHSWRLAYVQFKTNAAIRGAELNVWPDFHLRFTWIFCIIPFFLIALLPALLTISAWRKETPAQLRRIALAFLGSCALWLALNKSQLLTGYHFLFPSKNVFLAVFYSWPKFPMWLRILPLCALCTISFYYYKSDFLYLGKPLRAEERTYASKIKSAGLTSVDSLYFARFYRSGRTLNYEVSTPANYWPRYRAAIPESLRKEILEGVPDRPGEPDAYVYSAFTFSRMHQRPPAEVDCERPASFEDPLYALGRSWNLPAHPFALAMCVKK